MSTIFGFLAAVLAADVVAGGSLTRSLRSASGTPSSGSRSNNNNNNNGNDTRSPVVPSSPLPHTLPLPPSPLLTPTKSSWGRHPPAAQAPADNRGQPASTAPSAADKGKDKIADPDPADASAEEEEAVVLDLPQPGSVVDANDLAIEFGKIAADVAALCELEDASRQRNLAGALEFEDDLLDKEVDKVWGPTGPKMIIRDLLGAGAYGSVAEVDVEGDTPLAGRVFALKVCVNDAKRRYLWAKEAATHRLAAGAPGVVQLHYAACNPRYLFLGQGLAALGEVPYYLSERGPLTDGEVLGLGFSLVQGLAALHDLRVVHGDIKPDNLFVAPMNHPYGFMGKAGIVLGDLGLAWSPAISSGPLAPIWGGTPGYMAPELVGYCRRSPSFPADVYSVGVSLVVLGQPLPVEEVVGARSEAELVQATSKGAASEWFVGEWWKTRLGGMMAEVIGLCTFAHPECRPSARELIAQFEEWISEHHVLEQLPGLSTTAPDTTAAAAAISLPRGAASSAAAADSTGTISAEGTTPALALPPSAAAAPTAAAAAPPAAAAAPRASSLLLPPTAVEGCRLAPPTLASGQTTTTGASFGTASTAPTSAPPPSRVSCSAEPSAARKTCASLPGTTTIAAKAADTAVATDRKVATVPFAAAAIARADGAAITDAANPAAKVQALRSALPPAANTTAAAATTATTTAAKAVKTSTADGKAAEEDDEPGVAADAAKTSAALTAEVQASRDPFPAQAAQDVAASPANEVVHVANAAATANAAAFPVISMMTASTTTIRSEDTAAADATTWQPYWVVSPPFPPARGTTTRSPAGAAPPAQNAVETGDVLELLLAAGGPEAFLATLDAAAAGANTGLPQPTATTTTTTTTTKDAPRVTFDVPATTTTRRNWGEKQMRAIAKEARAPRPPRARKTAQRWAAKLTSGLKKLRL